MAQHTSFLTGVAVSAVVAATAWYGSSKVDLNALVSFAEASAPAQLAPPPTVDVFEVETRLVTEWQEFTGRFEAVDEVAIQARVSGYLDAVHFEPGQIVEQGDLLFSIDPRPYDTALAEASARLREAEAAAELAQSELARAAGLSASGHVSRSVLDTRRQEAAIAAATVASAQAAVDRAKLDLDFTEIHAPVTGRISDDTVSPGNLVSAGAATPALTTIVSLDPIHFVFDATEQQYLDYHRDDGEGGGFRDAAATLPVAAQLVGETGFSHHGKIDFVDNRLDRATGTIRARAVFDNADGAMTPGMFGRMRMAVHTETPRVLIPDRAIASDQATKFVWVVEQTGTVSRRDISPAGSHDGLRIVEGLQDGDQVIVAGQHMVGPGAQVSTKTTNQPSTEFAMR